MTFAPQASEGEELTLDIWVYQALGAASRCWESMEGTGVFQSDEAQQIGEALLRYIRENYATREEVTDLDVKGMFMSADGFVINFKGMNYYRACGEYVATYEDHTTTCVKPLHHKSLGHEDWDGQVKVKGALT